MRRVDVRRVFNGDFNGVESPFLNCPKSRVLALVNGEVNKKVLIPNLILFF